MDLHCPAKINLTLEVLARRDDGYHALRSLMVPVDLGDELSIEPSPEFAFSCDDASLGGDDNLVVRAARAVDPEARVRLTLRKRIPAQAGLGGGSSDAAAVLNGAMRGGFGSHYSLDWLTVARSLGSDVPFFLVGTGAFVEGTGERVTAVGALPPWHVLIVKPPVAVSTAAAYAELDRHERPSRPRNASVSLQALDALQRGDFADVERLLSNDFNDVIAAQTPEVARALDALRAAGGTNALLSGSGSAVFTLAREGREVARIAGRLDLPATYKRYETHFAPATAWSGNLA
jgi:4-diphosphocytidyl-2-C-methyl-D-erythritol kinase